MNPDITEKSITPFSLWITVAAVVISSALWLAGFLSSPLFLPEDQIKQNYRQNFTGTDNPEYQAEKDLAEAYWHRYPDVKQSEYWGPEGPLGIHGPRDHYEQHGRKEGRILKD
jgi:hypothetical protein